MYKRLLDLNKHLKSNSIFLFGPRQTGKSTLIQQSLPDAWYVDLLHRKTYQQLLAHPDLLEEWEKEQTSSIIVIDEVQKIPDLLDVVQRILFRTKGEKRFLLTGWIFSRDSWKWPPSATHSKSSIQLLLLMLGEVKKPWPTGSRFFRTLWSAICFGVFRELLSEKP